MIQKGIDLVYEWREFYYWALRQSDPRVTDWFMMSSIIPNLGVIFTYFVFLNVAPRLMKDKQPLEGRLIMSLYNAAMVVLNSYIFFEILFCSWKIGYSYSCQPVKYSYDTYEHRIARALWWFYMSKIIEMLDTVLFVLRKKNNQISFLHVYHHSSMVFLWWIGVKWVAGGQSFSSALINSFVHIIMYTYYGLSAYPSLRKYLWWKRFLTQFQLTQFCLLFYLAFQSLYINCDFPLWMQYSLCAYMVSFLVLFGNFYLQSYIYRQRNKPKRVVYENDGTVQNGFIANGHTSHGENIEKKLK